MKRIRGTFVTFANRIQGRLWITADDVQWPLAGIISSTRCKFVYREAEINLSGRGELDRIATTVQKPLLLGPAATF